jgi:aspartate ammonia-lyase
MSDNDQLRVERDSLGAVTVPAGALYGAHTVRGLGNFRVSGVTMRERPELIAAFGHVKAAAARANAELGVLDASVAVAVRDAAREVARGEHDDQFPLDVVQGGGGTASNMNANEVIANRAAAILGGTYGTYELVHPNDHVNRSQSTNDVYPTALALATVAVGRVTASRMHALAGVLTERAAKGADRERLGRTCLQDAVPLTVAQTHQAQAHAITRAGSALQRATEQLLAVPLGATAVGTGIGAPAGYQQLAVRLLAEESGLPVSPAENLFDELANLDGYVDVAAQAVRVALVLAKIASDLRFWSSPPVGEVCLPAVQVGSSIMPGKINPVIPELVMQVSFETRGMATIVEAAAAAGELELNVMEPVIARHLLAGLRELGRVAELFGERCVAGLEWQDDTLAAHLAGSRAEMVQLAAEEGYAHAARTATSSRAERVR